LGQTILSKLADFVNPMILKLIIQREQWQNFVSTKRMTIV